MAVADTDGNRLATSRVFTDPGLGARWNLDHGIAAAKALLDTVAPDAEVAAVGACTFGIPATHGIDLAPAIPGWGDLSLSLELEAAFGTRAVKTVTDVKAAAAAELRSGALVGHDPAIYVNLGTGLAVAIICNGRVVSGANGAAGEIGYNLRQPADVDLGLDERSILEDVVSGMAVAATGMRRVDEELSAADVFSLEFKDSRLAGALDDFLRELSFAIVNLAVAIDPSRIAVGGGMVQSWARIEPHLRKALEVHAPFTPELVVGAYPFDAALVGALAIAADANSPSGGSDSAAESAFNGRLARPASGSPENDGTTHNGGQSSIRNQVDDRSSNRGRVHP
jgi:glucokinase